MSGNDLRIDRLLGELQFLLGPALEIGKIIVRHWKTFQGVPSHETTRPSGSALIRSGETTL